MSDSESFKKIRQHIDSIDVQLQDLINQRVTYAIEIAKIKQELGDGVFYKPEREAQILTEVMDRNKGPMPAKEMARLFREIMSATLSVESRIKVAALGPAGTYTEAAAQKHFGKSVDIVLKNTIQDVFRAVQTHEVNYGVVPIENSSEGAVTHTLDLLIETPLKICGEIELRIRHCLLSKDDNLDNIVRVFAHGQSLAQCKRWLSGHLKSTEQQAVGSNADAAIKASEECNTAAIASMAAGEHYGLNVLARDIEDSPGNTTRFLLIGDQAVPPSGKDKTSLIVTNANKPGSLYKIIEPLSRYGVDMTRIESRPSRTGLWEYVFFIDILGHHEEENVAKVLEEIKSNAGLFKIIGSYPQAIL